MLFRSQYEIFKNSGIETFTYPDNAKLVVEDDLFANCPIKEVKVPKALYEQKGISCFLNPCLSDYMHQFYETDSKEFTEAIVFRVEGFKPLAIPRYVKPGSNFDKFANDVNPPRLIRFREYRRGFQTPHKLSFMTATLSRSGFLTTDTAQTQWLCRAAQPSAGASGFAFDAQSTA